MADDNKIYGSDIFDRASITQYYDAFRKYNQDAVNQVNALKSAIINLNKSLKGDMKFAKSMKELEDATIKYRRELLKLRQEYIKYENKVNSVTTKQNKFTESIKKANTELDKTNKSLTRASSGFNSLKAGVSALVGPLGIVGAVLAMKELVTSVYTVGKQLESISLTLKTVSKDSYEFKRSWDFLFETSEKFGLNLTKTAKSFATFRAAAKQSNLTLGETTEIFETFANAGANLGRTADEMDSIFLALEQMLSKGKVSTEELRRQLGERLPGAMGIMAKALDVTTAELDKMLRTGQVLSEDALPKFAETLKEVYGLDNSKRVATMAAAQERFNTAWIGLVDYVNKEGTAINSFFRTFWAVMTQGLEGFVAAMEVYDRFGFERTMDLFYKIVTKDYAGVADYAVKVSSLKRQEKYLADKEKFLKIYDLYITETGGKYDQSFVSMALGQAKQNSGILEEYIDNFEKLIEKMYQVKDAAKGEGEGGTRGLVEAILGPVRSGQLQDTEDWLKRVSDITLEIAKIQNDIDQGGLSAWDEEWAKARINSLEKVKKGILDISNISAMGTGPLERRNRQRNDENNKDEPTWLEKLLNGDEEVVDKFIKDTELIANATEELMNNLFALEEATHERRIARIDEEINKNNEKYDRLYKLAEGDADTQAKLRIRQEEENEKLEKKKKKAEYDAAKAKRKQALAEIAINTAVAITKFFADLGPAAIVAQAIVIAANLAAVAQVLAQPLPEYALGTNYHKGGYAVVGDGGKREIIQNPDGSMVLTSDKSEVVNMARGSKVIPDAQKFINEQIVKTLISAEKEKDDFKVEQIEKAILKGFRSTRITNNNTVKVSMDHAIWRLSKLN